MGDQQKKYILVVILVLVAIALVLGFLAIFTVAPVLCATMVGVFYVVMLYLATEGSSTFRWHNAQEFENRFWTITAFVFFTALFYARDSPFAIGRYNSFVGGVLVFSLTFAVHTYDRHLHRVAISRRPMMSRNASWGHLKKIIRQEHLFKYKVSAEEKTLMIHACLAEIDSFYLPSTVSSIFDYKKVIRQEQKILRILTGASKEELNYIVRHAKLALVMYKVKDHGTPDTKHRTAIMELLCANRLADLSISSRVLLLDALMIFRLSAHHQAQRYVRNIILKTTGDDLSLLKSLTDSKGDIHSMHKLVYNDITDPEIRRDIIQHIQQQAKVQAAHMALGTKYARMRREKPWRKILSDVDDTLFSSGGKYPAGIDVSYPHHQIYPGVLEFFQQLDMGLNGPDIWETDRVGNLVFLSARPHVYKDLAERRSYQKFTQMAAKGLHCVPSMLAGSLQSGSSFMLSGDLGPMALKKFENFSQYYQLYPEFTHVFIGDNGQGDVKAAELMVETFKDAIEAVFIHRVQPIEKTYGFHAGAEEKWRDMRIFFFDSYIGAGIIAYRRRLIRLNGLAYIARNVLKQFEAIQFKTDGWREAARWQVNKDLMEANRILAQHNIKTFNLVSYQRSFRIGMIVSTPFGLGIIKSFRGIDGVYSVSLSSDGGPPYSYLHQKVMTPLPRDSLLKSKPTAELKHSFLVNKSQVLTLNRDTTSIVVWTPFGYGVVQRYDEGHHAFEVLIWTLMEGPTPARAYVRIANVAPVRPSLTLPVPQPATIRGDRASAIMSFLRLNAGRRTPESAPVPASSPKTVLMVGSAVSTVFGVGILNATRPDGTLCVSLLSQPGAEAFLNPGHVRLTTQELAGKESRAGGFFRFFRKRFSSTVDLPDLEGLTPGETRPRKDSITEVVTPFGSGRVISCRTGDKRTPWPEHATPSTPSMKAAAAIADAAASDGVVEVALESLRYRPPDEREGSTAKAAAAGDQSIVSNAPVAYVQLSLLIKEDQRAVGEGEESFHIANSLRSWLDRVRFLAGRKGGQERGLTDSDTLPVELAKYSVGAFVRCKFGTGEVVNYRSWDNTYTVQFHSMPGVICYLQEKEIVSFAVIGEIGSPVLTTFGTGILTEVRPVDGVHVVSLPQPFYISRQYIRGWHTEGLPGPAEVATSLMARAYLHPKQVKGRLPAAVGDHVSTPYGLGLVTRYRPANNMYSVILEWALADGALTELHIQGHQIYRAQLSVSQKLQHRCQVM